MRDFAAAALAAVFAAGICLAGAIPADAKNNNSSRGGYSRNATNQRAWIGITQNPWDFPNCFVYSPKIRYWVWVCGPPYPKEMPHR